MRWTSKLSQLPASPRALADMMLEVERELGQAPDVLFVHITPHHRPLWQRLPSLLTEYFPHTTVIGVSGAGVLASGQEAEDGPAIAMLAGVLPNVSLRTFQFDPSSKEARVEAFTRALDGVPVDEEVAMVLYADPFSTPLTPLIGALDFVFPSATVVGGLASGGLKAGENLLFTNQGSVSAGAVGIAMWGDIQLDLAVAQGCRPVGPPMIVTKHRDNFIVALDDKPPMMVLRELFNSLPEVDQGLFRRSLQLGVASHEHTHHNGEDFLIRDIIGADAETHALAIAAPIERWQVVRFMLRDAQEAERRLRRAMSDEQQLRPDHRAEAALVFSSGSRGQALYESPNVDSKQILAQHPTLPLSGFFTNGEIASGPQKIELHTCSSTVGVLRSRRGAK